MKTITSAILLAALLSITGCKKKEDTKAAEPAAAEKKEADKPAEPKPAEGTPPENNIASDTDYETRATDLLNKLIAIFAAGGKDCDKLAADLTKFGDDNRKVFEAVRAYEKAHPEAEKKFDEKMKPREKEMEEKFGPAFDACQNHEGMKKAVTSLPLD